MNTTLPNTAPLPQRVARKIQRAAAAASQGSQRLAARAVFALPIVSGRDPRRNVTTLKSYCRNVPSVGSRSLPSGSWYVANRPPESRQTLASTTVNDTAGRAFEAGIQQYQGGRELRYPETFLAAIEGGRVYGREFTLLSRENKIFFESALSRADYLEQSGILDRITLGRPKRHAGECCLVANRSAHAYYHWFIEVLPKLATIEAYPQLSETPIVLPAKLSSFHTDSLRLAGINPDRFLRLAPGFREFDRVYFPELPGPTGIPSPHAVAWLRSRFLPAVAQKNGPGRRRVYLTRRDASQRRVLNEESIISVVSRLGFEVICPGDLPFAKQVELFSDVGFVIAPHGAGLTNLVFVPSGATVIEFFGDNYINGCFWALANLCGHRHGFLVGPSTWLDYAIPIADLELLLKKMGA